jgi:CheY-like chemotaxis protein/CRP-like cAMP-binding protein
VLRQTRHAADPLLEIGSGDELAAWVAARKPETAVIVADWDLPGLDGLGILDRLGGASDVGLLVCVNRAQIPLAEAAVQRGAKGYIVRPFSDEDLRVKIEAIGAALTATRSSEPSDIFRDIVTTVRDRQDLPTLLSLPSALISELFRNSTRTSHAAGETLVWAGERVDTLAFITSGQVEAGGTLRGPGDCIAERAFVCGQPSRMTLKARSAVDVVRVSKMRMVELARRHAAVRTFLTALIAAPEPEVDAELTGTLASLPFPDLLQFLNAARKTGVLLLEEAGQQGLLAFVDGEAHDARLNGEAGEEAFFRMAAWTHARFEFKAGPSSGARTLAQSTMKLLMDAYSRMDAGTAARDQVRAG